MVIIPWKYKKITIFSTYSNPDPYCGHVFQENSDLRENKISTTSEYYGWGYPPKLRLRHFFFANQTENYINFNPTSTKIAKSHFFLLNSGHTTK